MNTLCAALLRLVTGPGTSPAIDERTALYDLYFSEHAEQVDPGLLERLLWWEGVAAPEAGGR